MQEELNFISLPSTVWEMSLAADSLDISQPTGSLLLKKLRAHFADPLFVRTGQRMFPTPRAEAISSTISTLLQLGMKGALINGYESLTGSVKGFAQETAVHAIRLMTSGLFDRYPDLNLVLGDLGGLSV